METAIERVLCVRPIESAALDRAAKGFQKVKDARQEAEQSKALLDLVVKGSHAVVVELRAIEEPLSEQLDAVLMGADTHTVGYAAAKVASISEVVRLKTNDTVAAQAVDQV